ncbi:MAG: RcpC/CpaB family pilus assembly protein [Elusimicrobiota bacterium]
MKFPALLLALSIVVPAVSAAPKAAAPDNPELLAGYRATSLSVPAHQLRFLSVGDRIDVMATFDATMEDKKTEAVTATILQNVIVLAVDQAAGVISLELNPNEAQYAALFDSKDKLWLSRRAKGDTEMHPMEMASARKLFR